MRYKYKNKKLNFYNTKHRIAVFRSMIISLFMYDNITTTKTKSKIVVQNFNHICTKIKHNINNNKVHLLRWLRMQLAINRDICNMILQKFQYINITQGNTTYRRKVGLNATGHYKYRISVIKKIEDKTSLKK